MKILLIGATGFVGTQVLNELLQREHQVTALVRSSGKLTASGNLNVIVADAYDADSVAAAAEGHDAVISAFNPGWQDSDLYNNFMRGSDAIERGVEKAGIQRLLVVGGAGSLFVAPGVQLVDTQQFADHAPAFVVPGAKAARDTLTKMRGHSRLDWTFVSPPAMLAEGPRTGHYRLGSEDLLMDGDKPAGISVADLAVAIVDEIEQPKHVRARFTAASQAV